MPTRLPVYCENWDYYPHVFKGYVQDALAGYHLYWDGSELSPYGSLGCPNQGLPAFYSIREDGGFVPPPADLDKLVSDSLRRMMPGIKAELSLINSLIELKDFRSYVKLMKNPWERLQKLPTSLRTMLKKAWDTGVTLRQASRGAASSLLEWRFAIAPLLSDISGIHAALSRTEKRMNDLVTRAGRPQKRHYTVNWIEYQDSDEAYPEAGRVQSRFVIAPASLYAPSRAVRYEPTIFHAEIEYNYYFTQYQLEHARVLSVLDALGVNCNPAIIWNALPWSFVVDWVVGVGRWFDAMKTRNMEPMINVRRYLWSVKRERRILVSRKTIPFYGLPPEQSAPAPVVTETAYRRTVGIPDWNSFFTSGISSDELVLGAALVIARRRRRNRR